MQEFPRCEYNFECQLDNKKGEYCQAHNFQHFFYRVQMRVVMFVQFCDDDQLGGHTQNVQSLTMK